MDFLPIFLTLRERHAVLIGGGTVAARKAELLLAAGAQLRVVAPSLTDSLHALAAAGRIQHIARPFLPADLDGAVLAVAATDSVEVNSAVGAAARERGVLVNVVDDRQRSTFIMPAIVDRSPVIVAIGSGGNAPVLARYVREKIEGLLSPRLGRLASLAGRWRGRVKRQFQRLRERRQFWERVFEGPVASHVLAGREEQAELELRRELKRTASGEGRPAGEVYLIGAGPGDPDLLTLKAARLLQRADVILYDRLISEEVLARARRDAERIYVGKEPGKHGFSQENIHRLIVKLAKQGKRVCRLKGGDPFVFGRGGEELEILVRHRIPCTVVPGITAALGAAAYAGIPLTHRDHAHSVTFVTGHQRSGADSINWHDLARDGHTSVFYMGLGQLQDIVAQLLAAGAPQSRPAAVIERATFADQRVIEASLASLAQAVEAAKVVSPSLLIVGDVVALRCASTGETADDHAAQQVKYA